MLRLRASKTPQTASWLPAIIRRISSDAQISNRLFVGGLCYDTNETVLKDAFKEFGEIVEVKVICDRWTGKSKGFAFIQFDSDNGARNALQEMDGQMLEGRSIRVYYYAKKE